MDNLLEKMFAKCRKNSKFKMKKGNSQSKDRNYALNRNQQYFRPDFLYSRSKTISVNDKIGRFSIDEDFDEFII